MTRLVRVLGIGTLGAFAVLTACEGKRTTENDPFGPPSYNFRLTGLSRGLPRTAGNDALFLTFGTFDTSVVDAFGRQANLSVTLRFATNWNLASTFRRLSTDGRAPTMTATTATALAGTFTLEGPEGANAPGLWRFNISLTNLTASTGYTIALFRYGLKVVDSLDHSAALLTGSNSAVRDSLFVLGGGGASASLTGGCSTLSAAASSATANPLIIGTFTSNSSGASTAITRCINDASGLYYRATDIVNPNKTPIAPNTGLTFSLPQYNYIVVYNTTTGAIAGSVLRAQIGQDLDNATGNPVDDAFAPYPCPVAATSQCASNVLSSRGKINAPGGDAIVDSARLSFRGLKDLGTGVYQAWLVNPAASPPVAPVPALGRLVVSQLDTVTDVPVLVTNRTVLDSTTTDVSTFVGYAVPQASHVTWEFRPTSTASGVAMANYTHVLITLESGAGAAAPSANTALWYRYGDQKGTATLRDDSYLDASSSLVVWGRLDLANLATRVFAQAGSGFGGIRGDEISVDFTSLPRPPAGYFYQAWLQDVNGPDTIETATGTYIVGKDTSYLAIDTLRAPFPGRALLLDADASIPDPVVQDVPPVISSSNIRALAGNLGLDLTRLCVPTNPARGACPFGRYDSYLVTLEPKGSSPTSPSPSVVFVSGLPGLAKTGR